MFNVDLPCRCHLMDYTNLKVLNAPRPIQQSSYFFIASQALICYILVETCLYKSRHALVKSYSRRESNISNTQHQYPHQKVSHIGQECYVNGVLLNVISLKELWSIGEHWRITSTFITQG